MAKQKSGLYRTKVTVGHDADGKPIVKYISGKTKRELEDARQEIIETYTMAATDTRREILFTDYVQEWYNVYKEPHISESNKQNYRSILNMHILPAFQHRQLRSISAIELQKFMNSKSGLSATTLGYICSVLKNVFSTAYTHGLVERDPSHGLKKPSAEKENRRALTAAETAAALAVGREHPEGLLLLVLYYTGARRGEALGLMWEDIDFVKKTISIRRDVDFASNTLGTVKTKCSIRDIPMPPPLETVLRPLRGTGKAFLFPAPESGNFIPQSTFVRRWNRLMKAVAEANKQQHEADQSVERIEQKNGKSVLTAHYFRHNYTSILYNAGVDLLAAQKYLGHADVKTTLSIYAHLSEGKEQEAADKVRSAFTH